MNLRTWLLIGLSAVSVAACTPSGTAKLLFETLEVNVSANIAEGKNIDLVLKNTGNAAGSYELLLPTGLNDENDVQQELYVDVDPISAPGTIAAGASQTWKAYFECPVDAGTYTQNISAKQGANAVTVTIKAVCKDAPIPDVKQPSADVIDATAAAGLISYNATTGDLVFNSSSPQLTSIKVGDGIVSQPSPIAPNGFLRRVLTIVPGATTTTITTEQGDLSDVIDSGDVNEVKTADASKIQTLSMHQGVTRGTGARSQSELNYNFNDVVVDQDGDLNTTNDQFRINGDLNIKTQVKFEGKFNFTFRKGFSVQAKFSTRLEQAANLVADGAVVATIQKRIDIATVRLPSITFFVGVVPVVITNSMRFYLDVTLGINGVFNYTVKQGFFVEAGLEYDQGFKPIFDRGSNFEQNFNFTGNLTARAMISARFVMALYGIVGPFGEFGVGPQITVQTADANGGFPYTIDGCVKASAGLDLELRFLRKKWTPLTLPLFDACAQIAQGTFTPPAPPAPGAALNLIHNLK